MSSVPIADEIDYVLLKAAENNTWVASVLLKYTVEAAKPILAERRAKGIEIKMLNEPKIPCWGSTDVASWTLATDAINCEIDNLTGQIPREMWAQFRAARDNYLRANGHGEMIA